MLMQEPAVYEPVARRSRFVLGVRVTLALAWLAWAVASFWMAPRQAEVSQLIADMRAGRVVSYTTSPSRPPYLWVGLATSPQQQRDMLSWQTGDGRSFYTYPNRHMLDREDLADQLARQGTRYGEQIWLQRAEILSLVLAIAAFFILLHAPDPVRGTRPFWFWVGQLPFGIGFVAWLALERPWSRVTDAPRKRNGYIGFAYMLLGGLATGIIIELIT